MAAFPNTPKLAIASGPSLTVWTLDREKKQFQPKNFSREALFSLSEYAIQNILSILNTTHLKGIRILHHMTKNSLEEIILRLAAFNSGYVPVTVNWQADNLQTSIYKAACTKCQAIFCDEDVEDRDMEYLKNYFRKTKHVLRISEVLPSILFQTSTISHPIFEKHWENHKNSKKEDSSEEIIVFTSGTTALPKGVLLTFGNFNTTLKSFEDAFDMKEGDDSNSSFLILIITNPLHHVNSTAFCRWFLSRRNCALHLFEKYSSSYWKELCSIITYYQHLNIFFKAIIPLVSKHIEFLYELVQTASFFVESSSSSFHQLQEKVSPSNIIFALGSGPVGPSTISKFQKLFDGKLPLIRFGSTESCLQICATPLHLTTQELYKILKRGWEFSTAEGLQKGYYIGRPHQGITAMKIVKSTDKSHEKFMVECGIGETGYIICKGENMMQSYVNLDSWPFSMDGWYLGLGDIGYTLMGEEEGAPLEFFWLSRDSELLIKGGVNYSFLQINEEMKRILFDFYGLASPQVDVAAIGKQCMFTLMHSSICKQNFYEKNE
ncbi:hypothetical protein IE077_001570 [Cardiosporidium cionae]|uniref:AMP-dependent synthetase/ligase domain-containing protein n=1 Tax=Cardiosporidium cionae TaxID=476202 RepID=A0ABQ7JCZ6_9APIC|nr:hypothetical protein IE077_001570 [Cardiosporidium cionae]|eukprot:KAF8821790.1 hypothetical protein IE077_001570 [Cardiosporidium cionae]